ncbi:hypothetical protein C477_04284 [Haloterrigena salina JCM 13891]|uniref:Uncharacterized protein n=1 Tax=Haloterrigena salina JCM 13891 TaxID=1227488 RepID=M0CJZ3_9EURY|nr:hypothetical protein [Haloterrigena salina]ELZ22209.1 hypothetical protein C477_04284 [Haloterrigena salina JCM 13891]
MSDPNLEAEEQTSYEETATRGQPAQPAANQEALTDLLTEPLTKAYVKAIVALYALLGAGMGLIVILSEIVDESIVDGGIGSDFVALTFAGMPISGVPHIAATIALLVGGYLGVRMAADDRQTMLTAGAGALAGTAALWILSSFLAVSQLDNTDIEVGGLIINAVVLGLVVGAIAAGTVYVMRNLVPDVQRSAA